ncbi:bromodomain and WD repeat-containing protein 1 [Pelodytes ibericus]
MADSPGPSSPPQLPESELYFLIARFLANGPCRKTAEMMIQELNENKLLPKRVDWLGNEHIRSFEQMTSIHSRLAPDHLLQMCKHLTSVLDMKIPSNVFKASSFLGVGKQSVLRTEKDCRNVQWNRRTLAALHRGRPPEMPINLKWPPNVVDVHHGKHLTGAVSFTSAFPVSMYQRIKMQKRILGHLSSVYCVAFDRTGQRIFTGSDDCLLKIWSTLDGRLLATLRGHSAEISEITVNYENTLIATTSCEKLIRVWSLRTCAPVAVLQGHSVSVNFLIFSPLVKGSVRYLVSTGGDATVCLWQWDVDTLKFNDRPLKFIEKSGPGAKILCCSCSAGGMFLAAGGSDHAIRMYYFGFETPEKMTELEGHTGIIDSILFSNHGERFVTGSKDGTARIWYLEEQEWNSITLDMAKKLDNSSQDSEEDKFMKPKVLMLSWNMSDSVIVTATSTYNLKVWDSHTGSLLHIMMNHQNDIYVLEPHPFDPRIMLSAGYDGRIFIWDVTKGSKIKHYFNAIEGQGHGAILDCKLSSDGQHVASTDSHGHLLIFGFGSSKAYDRIPDQMFFHTDYRPLCRDASNYVLDEQTQQAPHLMPPPFLVDVDGNPHPPKYQRLVPGRETCADKHLIPQLGYIETSYGEVVEQVIGQQTNDEQQNPDASVLDGIRQLQRTQEQRLGPEQGPGISRQLHMAEAVRRDLVSPPNIGLRRSGQVEGVRQMHQNSPRSQIATERDLLAWKCRVVVPAIPYIMYKQQEEFRIAKGKEEKVIFVKQKKQDPTEENHEFRTLRNRYKPATRSHTFCREVEDFFDLSCEEGEETEMSSGNEEEVDRPTEVTSASPSDDEEWGHENNTGDSSSEYSDWTAQAGINLRPPNRTSARRKVKRLASSSDNESSAEETSPRPGKRTSKQKNQNGAVSDPVRHPLDREISNTWRPSVWITDTIPHRSPFVPQMGDEVIYFRQGHEAYINAVTRNNLIISNSLKEPWKKTMLRDQEVVKIVGIRYEAGPPTLCCLKLALIDHVTGKLTDQSFSLKYHDMPDVIDFLVLRQLYDRARERNWQAGERFRSIIDDAWWFGTIVSQEPYQADYPDSLFQCYTVKWDNNETERLSPWDMDFIPDDVIPPEELGASISVTPDELDNLLYSPQEGEWGNGTQDSECERIICGIDQLLYLEMASAFAVPVDLNIYPSYCVVVAYPTDLSTIRMRLVNRFYRRVSALMWEVRYIELNASTFNEPDSAIAKSAKRISDLLVKFIMDSDCTNIEVFNTSDGDDRESSSEQQKPHSDTEATWKKQCRECVDFIIECEDCEPFREPVDLDQYTDYQDIVMTPMDFGTIKKLLAEGKYRQPMDLRDDMKLVFSNAKLYTPNKRSRIYSMALRLSALVEEKMKVIISAYKLAQNSKKKPENEACSSKRLGTQKEHQNKDSPRGLRQKRVSPWTEKEILLGPSSSRPTSSSLIAKSSQNNVSSVPGRSLRSAPPANAAIASSKCTTTTSEADSDQSSSYSENESDSESSTSATSHSSESSSCTSTEASNKPVSRHKINNFKTKGSSTKKHSYAKPVSQGKKQKQNRYRKRTPSSYSDESASSSLPVKDMPGSRKKVLRKSAALAANKIKCIGDVEDNVPSSDSDYSASKNSRTLPHRLAAAKAKKRLMDAKENGLTSDSETEAFSQRTTHSVRKLESDSNDGSSDSSSHKPSTEEDETDHRSNGKTSGQSVDEQSWSDSPSSPPPDSTQGISERESVVSSSSDTDDQILKRNFSKLGRKTDDRAVTRSKKTCLTTSEENLASPENRKTTRVCFSSDSESDINACRVRNRWPSPVVSSPTSKSKVLQDSESTSDSESEDGEPSESFLSDFRNLHKKTNGKHVFNRAAKLKRSKIKYAVSEGTDSGQHHKLSQTSDDDSEDILSRKRKKRVNARCDSGPEDPVNRKRKNPSKASFDDNSDDTDRRKRKKTFKALCDSDPEDQVSRKRKKLVKISCDEDSEGTDSGKWRNRLKSSCDDDWEVEDVKHKKLTRRSKIRTRNQGKRNVRYNDGENSVQS